MAICPTVYYLHSHPVSRSRTNVAFVYNLKVAVRHLPQAMLIFVVFGQSPTCFGSRVTCDHVVCRPRNSGGLAGRGARGPHDVCLPSPLGHPLRGWYSLGVPCWQGSAARLLLAQAATVEEANTCECRVSVAEAVLNARVRAAGPLPFEWRLLPLKYFDVSNNSLTGDLSFLPRSLLSSQF